MNKIIFYFMPTCTHCIEAKFYMEQKGMEFELINITKDLEGLARMREISGQIGAPVFEIGGRILIGFNPRKLEQLYLNDGQENN